MNKKNIIGKTGEDIACEYLIKKGWAILQRNWKRRGDEVDIILKTGDETLIFCEVKTMFIGNLTPEDNLTSAKLRKFIRVAEFFTRQYPELIHQDRGWRMDLLAIDLSVNGKAMDIRHYENI